MSDLSEGKVTVTLKCGAGTVEVDTTKLPENVIAEIFSQGLKVLLERATSGITKSAEPNEETRKEKIHAKALENLEKLEKGEVKVAGAKAASKVPALVQTEAMRIAREMVKNDARARKIKLYTLSTKVITEGAKAILEAIPAIFEQAKANIDARSTAALPIDLSGLVKASKELEERAEAKKAKAKAAKEAEGKPILSAAQAKKVSPRQRHRQQANA